MIIALYALKVLSGAAIIYLLLSVVSRGNHRNTPLNALITAALLGLSGELPLLFGFLLVAWVYLLINWYSIGLIKSFVSATAYAIIFILLSVFFAAVVPGSSSLYSRYIDFNAVTLRGKGLCGDLFEKTGNIPVYVRNKLSRVQRSIPGKSETLPGTKARIVFTNGRTIDARILKETADGYCMDIADGKAEVFVGKDTVEYIEYQKKE
ncbi:MAG: hypothetical protein P9L88_03135 [Candidatus Tantalella remota]|nr:hypothetical protein [Candidatus Tantalella remota]